MGSSSKKGKKPRNEKEFLKLYGKLDWDVGGKNPKEKAENGKRYENCSVMMNLNTGEILECEVVAVDENGFSVIESGKNIIIPFDAFFHVFLKGFTEIK